MHVCELLCVSVHMCENMSACVHVCILLHVCMCIVCTFACVMYMFVHARGCVCLPIRA